MTRLPTNPKHDEKESGAQAKKARTLTVNSQSGKSQDAQVAEFAARGVVPMASVLTAFSKDIYSDELSLTHAYLEFVRLSEAATAGDLSHVERLLSAQLLSLSSIFAGLALRSKTNTQGGYLGAADTYMRLALRAQSQCRQTAQTLFEMKNPRPVSFVQQANISNGPQQVNNSSGPRSAVSTETGTVRGGARAHAGENAGQQNELLEMPHGNELDTRTAGAAGRTDPHLEAMAAGHRAAHP